MNITKKSTGTALAAGLCAATLLGGGGIVAVASNAAAPASTPASHGVNAPTLIHEHGIPGATFTNYTSATLEVITTVAVGGKAPEVHTLKPGEGHSYVDPTVFNYIERLDVKDPVTGKLVLTLTDAYYESADCYNSTLRFKGADFESAEAKDVFVWDQQTSVDKIGRFSLATNLYTKYPSEDPAQTRISLSDREAVLPTKSQVSLVNKTPWAFTNIDGKYNAGDGAKTEAFIDTPATQSKIGVIKAPVGTTQQPELDVTLGAGAVKGDKPAPICIGDDFDYKNFLKYDDVRGHQNTWLGGQNLKQVRYTIWREYNTNGMAHFTIVLEKV